MDLETDVNFFLLQIGTHHELLAKKGLYAELVKRQTKESNDGKHQNSWDVSEILKRIIFKANSKF